MKPVYIFGHKSPDTDSICSSIALAYLKKELKINAKACSIGDINDETKYVLDYFKVDKPLNISDVKLRLKDFKYHKNCYVEENTSIYDSYLYMICNELTGLAVVDNKTSLLGYITMKDIAKDLINGNFSDLDTSYDNIVKILKAEEVLKYDEEIKGQIRMALFKTKTFLDNIKLTEDNILIVGNRPNIIEYAIKSKVKLIIVLEDNIDKDIIDKARENKINIIKTNLTSYEVAKYINLCNYIKTIIINYKPVSFNKDCYYSDFLIQNEKLRHTNYPIVDNNNKCLGLFSIKDINKMEKQPVILVDHNEVEQSILGIEEADIIEIIDHHNLGSLTTKAPINFRNMKVGSTCTIIYQMYLENNVNLPKDMAGLLLSGILSDTMILKSPTTTNIDKEVVNVLANYLDINYEEYGYNMFKAGVSLKGKSIQEVFYTDFKTYTVKEDKIGIGQIFTVGFDDFKDNLLEYKKYINNLALESNYLVIALFITDIIKNGSYVIYNDKAKTIMEESFNITLEDETFIEDVVSRKQQVIPKIMSILE